MVAVKVTCWPCRDGLPEVISVVVVLAGHAQEHGNSASRWAASDIAVTLVSHHEVGLRSRFRFAIATEYGLARPYHMDRGLESSTPVVYTELLPCRSEARN